MNHRDRFRLRLSTAPTHRTSPLLVAAGLLLTSACAVACGDSGVATMTGEGTSDAGTTDAGTTDAGTTGAVEMSSGASSSGTTTDASTTGGGGSTTTADDSSTTSGDGSSGTTEEPLVGHAEFVLSGEDYDDVPYSWSNEGGNLVYCYYYSGAAKGDYLWIRFAESPDANGDSSPHIDMDVCRFSTDGFGGSFSAMDPTKFGSQCPADPGWGIWWHEGSVAYNNEPTAPDCELVAEVEGQVVTGTFSCTPVTEVDGEKSLTVSAGSFSCLAEAK